MLKNLSGIFIALIFLSAFEMCFSQSVDTLNGAKPASYVHISLDSVKTNLTKYYAKIAGMRVTGDVENDFATAIIAYDRAIEPALESEIHEGQDAFLISLARKIQTRHNDVVEILRTYLGKVKVSQVKKNDADEVTGSIKSDLTYIVKDISSKVIALKLTNKQDDDFASIINLHNQGVIQLGENYLDYGEDQVLIRVVQKMIDENQQDVDLTDKYLKSLEK